MYRTIALLKTIRIHLKPRVHEAVFQRYVLILRYSIVGSKCKDVSRIMHFVNQIHVFLYLKNTGIS